MQLKLKITYHHMHSCVCFKAMFGHFEISDFPYFTLYLRRRLL